MGFLGVYRAVFDYAPQGDGELEITEGDLLFVLEKSSDDDWWRAKKKAVSDDEDEPEGLIPNNYVEEAQPTHSAKALYDYTKQTEEEISFQEDAQLDVYDATDPDWTLVGYRGDFGFAPAIYIQDSASAAAAAPPAMPKRPQAQAATPDFDEEEEDDEDAHPSQNPAKALAGIIAQRTGGMAPPPARYAEEPASPPLPQRPMQSMQYTPEDSEEESAPPPMPTRSRLVEEPSRQSSQGVVASPPYNRAVTHQYDDDSAMHPAGGYRLFNVHEVVSSLGKNKKLPTILGINLARGLISIAPAKSRDGTQQEWTAEKLANYSVEGKHVFVELVRPSKSVDFHAGAKDTAAEITSMLGELAGASRASGLREVIAATSGGPGGQKTGQMLYEFMAQGDDEVTVATGDEVIILDDTKSDEWWMVRRLKTGKEGVVPSSYVEITGTLPVPSGSNYSAPRRSVVEQNRLEEERMTKEAARNHRRDVSDVSISIAPPARDSSLGNAGEDRRSNNRKKEQPKSKPNQSRVRTWTDRSGAFRVDAEFLGLKDNKIHLHKENGVKIAVPVGKMAMEDLEYVEKVTGVSLEDEKPLPDVKRKTTQKAGKSAANGISAASQPEYDWFDFFLSTGVNPQICERYAQIFAKDQIGEETLPDVTPALLRTLGLKEGDILRVMKFLDQKFGRTNGDAGADTAANGGGLFSGPGGTLRNNTRKGRPAPAVETNDVISAEGLKVRQAAEAGLVAPEPEEAAPPPPPKPSGFDDDAWSVKPSKSPAPPASQTSAAPPRPPPAPAPQVAPLAGSLTDLSVLSPALEPTRAPAPTPAVTQAAVPEPSRPSADAAFFDQLSAPAQQNVLAQSTGRQRPMAPPLNSTASTIAPPPRSSSAPGFPQQQPGFGTPAPLLAQHTGYQLPMQTGFQAPPGQSLQAIQQRNTMSGTQFPQQQMPFQQQGLQPQQTGYPGNPLQPQMTGYYPQQQQQQLQMQPTGSPFGDSARVPFQPQPTGFNPSFNQQPQQFSNPNTALPPALTPMRTGMPPNGFYQPQLQPQQTGYPPQQQPYGGFAQQQQQPPPLQMGYQQTGFPAQQLPPQQTGMTNGFAPQQLQPLQPQKTGPAPPVRFGTQPAIKPLVAMPTGRRANLGNATPQNPFGF